MKKAVIVSLLILLTVGMFANGTGNAKATSAPKITKITSENVFVARKVDGVDVWKAGPGELLQDGDEVMVGLGSEAQVTYPDGSQWKGLQGTCLDVKYKPPPEPKWYTKLWNGIVDVTGFVGTVIDTIDVPKKIWNLIKGKSLFKVFFDNETGISEISVFNGTVSVTAMRNEILIDSCNITGSLYFDEYGIPWANDQEITIYENGTISEPIEVLLDATEMAFTPYASDSQGIPIDWSVSYFGEDIYVCGYGALLRNNTDVSVYLMPYNVSLIEYSPDKAVVGITATADAWGNLPPTYLWKPIEPKPIDPIYNIWIDRDNSGSYTEGDMINYLKVQASVGGVWVSVDKFALLSPYIALTSTILVATAATAIYVKRKKKRQ